MPRPPFRPEPRETDPPLSTTDYVVLGMTSLGARSGYEIRQAVELSIRFFWNISHAQIYPSLQRLEAAGLIRGWDEPHGRRPRRLLEVTEAGQQVLRTWLTSEEAMPFELRDIALVRLYFADRLEKEDALSLAAAVRERSQERVDTLRKIESDYHLSQDPASSSTLTLRLGIAFHEAMITVCDEYEDEQRAALAWRLEQAD
jgi:DNA-binding PadR family transcriptional regulator